MPVQHYAAPSQDFYFTRQRECFSLHFVPTVLSAIVLHSHSILQKQANAPLPFEVILLPLKMKLNQSIKWRKFLSHFNWVFSTEILHTTCFFLKGWNPFLRIVSKCHLQTKSSPEYTLVKCLCLHINPSPTGDIQSIHLKPSTFTVRHRVGWLIPIDLKADQHQV